VAVAAFVRCRRNAAIAACPIENKSFGSPVSGEPRLFTSAGTRLIAACPLTPDPARRKADYDLVAAMLLYRDLVERINDRETRLLKAFSEFT
jgi:hypothetical protein